MAYIRFRNDWMSGTSGGTPITADSLDHIEAGIESAATTADDANTAAGNAQSTADTATTTANSAQSTANAAQTAADNAQTSANTAQTTANAAAKVLIWDGSAWTAPVTVPKIYLKTSGDPDPTPLMVEGDILWSEASVGTLSYIGGDSNSGGDNTTPQTLVMPTVETNDIGIIVIVSDGLPSYPNYSLLSGWAQASTQNLETNRNSKTEVWWKTLTVGESNVTFTPDVSAERAGHLSVWRGASQTAPVGNVSHGQHTAEPAPTPTAVTAVANAGIIVVQYNLGTTATTAFVAPSGYNLRTDERSVWGTHSATATIEDIGNAGLYSPPAWQSTASSNPNCITATIEVVPA